MTYIIFMINQSETSSNDVIIDKYSIIFSLTQLFA